LSINLSDFDVFEVPNFNRQADLVLTAPQSKAYGLNKSGLLAMKAHAAHSPGGQFRARRIEAAGVVAGPSRG
jgi:hypothetical protein